MTVLNLICAVCAFLNRNLSDTQLDSSYPDLISKIKILEYLSFEGGTFGLAIRIFVENLIFRPNIFFIFHIVIMLYIVIYMALTAVVCI